MCEHAKHCLRAIEISAFQSCLHLHAIVASIPKQLKQSPAITNQMQQQQQQNLKPKTTNQKSSKSSQKQSEKRSINFNWRLFKFEERKTTKYLC